MNEPARGARQVSRRVRRNRTVAVAATVVVLGGLVTGAAITQAQATDAPAAPTPTPDAPAPEPTLTPAVRPTPATDPGAAHVDTFDASARSIDDPASVWIVVNKQRPLTPTDFVPPDLVSVPVPHTWEPLLRQEASDAAVAMFTAAQLEAGLTLASNSAYRSYSTQSRVYASEAGADGQAAADLSVARPGHSEHQTGLAMDIGAGSGACSIQACFADTAEGRWVAENAHRFGFVLRYPADKTPVTGFEFEPWHYRYIGVELSERMRELGVTTLEEFFGLPAAPGY